MVELLDLRALRFTQSFENTRWVRNRPGDDLADRFVLMVLSQGTAAISNELVQIKPHRDLLYCADLM